MPILDYRYPTENQTLVITLVVMLGVLLVVTPLTLGTFLLLFILGFGLNYFFVRARIAGLQRSAVRITAQQFPEIKQLVDECRQRVDIPSDTEVYLSYSPVMNAFATGVGKPYSIVLYSALVEALEPDELKSVLGHEMGHIKFGHTTLLTLVGQLGGQTFGLPFVGDLIRYTFLFWMRTTEFTADRAGLVACGRLDKAITTEVKLAVGPELAKRVNLTEVARQAYESRGSLLGVLGEMQGTHPMMTTRIQQMVDFAFSDDFGKLRPDITVQYEEGSGVSWMSAASKGTPLTQLLTPKRTCSQCQLSLEAHWKVCPRCGHRR